MQYKQVLSQQSSVFLNLVRLTAAELVVLGHYITKYQPAAPYDDLFRLGSTMGGAAVLLFFTLSGLLISLSLFSKLDQPNSNYGFRSYFIDRFSRIYSGLIPALILSAVIAALIYATNYSYYAELTTMQTAPSALTFTMTALMLDRFPVEFFNSLLSGWGLTFPLPQITPFGFNGILWTLVVDWWIYMFFGWITIGALAFVGKRQKTTLFKIGFFVVALLLSLVLAGLFLEYSGLVIAWFLGTLITLALSSEKLRTKLQKSSIKQMLTLLLPICLVATALAVYTTFAWTSQFYDPTLGLTLSLCVFLTVLLLNIGSLKPVAKLLQSKLSQKVVANGAGFSYTLFLTHYPIIIFLNGLDLEVNRFVMLLLIMLLTNIFAYSIALFTEKKHRQLAVSIKKKLHLPPYPQSSNDNMWQNPPVSYS